MKRFQLALLLGALLAALPAGAQVNPVPPLMNFQGRLAKPDGTPVTDGTYSVRFSLWNAASEGTELWNQTVDTVTVKNGVFSALLTVDTPNLFDGDLWLEIKIGEDAPLTPRQRLVSTAYAMKANSVPDGSITTAQIADGAITASKLDASIFTASGLWSLTGNAGLDPSTSFLGTTDNVPLIFKVNGFRAMRYDYVEHTGIRYPYRGINVLGGIAANSIAGGVIGATIAGGGRDYFTGVSPNRVTADFGTIGGGAGNNVLGQYASVLGGSSNTASSSNDVVAGGSGNIAGGGFSAVGGGLSNIANGSAATIAGGQENAASGAISVVAGGWHNTASGDASFAAGLGAQAKHPGAFVWADALSLQSTDIQYFASTGPNQFLIRASGGVGIGTAAPDAPLTVAGNIHEGGTDFRLTGRGGGAGNNGGLGRALVDFGSGGLVLNFGNDFGKVTISSDTIVQGQMTVNTLNLQGADLAEKFDVQEKIAPGMVVAIDPDHEGKLKLASGAYNRRVAGIVSGAGKLPAGVVLSAPNEKAKDVQPIAMSGRVWVWCDATRRGVEPGDFLTTAKRPGYAMKVADMSRAQGAILGKAMTRLHKGEAGLVLVLVNLQ